MGLWGRDLDKNQNSYELMYCSLHLYVSLQEGRGASKHQTQRNFSILSRVMTATTKIHRVDPEIPED